eukprot:scaffold4722_cov60-Phaeocystis_antarctica.AAC.2
MRQHRKHGIGVQNAHVSSTDASGSAAKQPGVAILLAHVPAVHPVIVARPVRVGLVVLAHQIVDGLGAVLGAQPLYGRGRVGVEQRLVEELGHLA